MQRLLWVLTGFLSAAAIAFAISWRVADTPPGPSRSGDGRVWTYAWPEDEGFRDLPDRFTLPLHVTLGDSPGSAARVVIHADGEGDRVPASGVFVEVSRGPGPQDGASTGVRGGPGFAPGASPVRGEHGFAPGASPVSGEHGFAPGVGGAVLRFGRLEGGVALERWSGPLAGEPDAGRAIRLEIKRRGAELAVVADGRLAVRASEPAFSGGRTALAYAGGARPRLGQVLRLPEFPDFSDDFMRTKDEPGPWKVESGNWVIETLPTPSMSANGFSYRGRSAADGAPALALGGSRAWDQYRLGAAVRGEPGEALGLVFGARADGQCAVFRWTSREADGGGGRRELVLVGSPLSGELPPEACRAPGAPPAELVLASSPVGYLPGQWYRVEIEFEFGRARVYVDDHEVLAARSPEITSGRVGLWSSGEKGSTFDDVVVVPYRSVEEDFGAAGAGASSVVPRAPGPEWEALGGEWAVAGGRLAARVRAGGASAKLLTGSPYWRRFTSRAEVVRLDEGAEAGIVASYRDEGNHVLLKAEGKGRFSLERVRAGRRETLATARGPEDGELVLELSSDRGYLAGRVNGRLLLESWDGELLEGRTGLWVARAPHEGEVQFRRFRSELIPHRPPVNAVNVVFEADDKMSRWAGTGADWYETRSRAGWLAHWHRAPFFGDTELAIDLPGDALQSGRVVLGISKAPDHPQNGYGWEFDFSPARSEPPGEAGDADVPPDPVPVAPEGAPGAGEEEASRTGGDISGPHGKLWREGVVMDEAALESGQRLDSLFVRRQGSYVCAGVNGTPLAQFVDPDPLEGGRVAYLVEGLEGGAGIDPSRVRLSGGRFFDYLFAGAPVDWRSAAGLWEVTSRWECDERWSFFVGRYDPESERKEAVVWNKRRFPGDVVIDFYVGPWMEKPRGRKYEYIRDINVTIAADGRDITTGYTFSFAGFGNTASAILRRGEIVAEDRSVRALFQRDMRIHQRWHHVRVERTGALLRYTVEFQGVRKVELEYEDPEPLAGDRIAIWTYDCGIVFARLRIAAEEGGGLESPDFVPPPVTRTFYDDGEADTDEDDGQDTGQDARKVDRKE